MKKVFKDFDKISAMNIKWWEKIVLFFLPTHISCDVGVKEKANVWIEYKKFNKKIYLVG